MTKKHNVELTDAEMRKMTKLALAEQDRQAQAAAAKHKARPENRSARLRQAEAEVKASTPRDRREIWSEMNTDTRRPRAKPTVRKQVQSKSMFDKAELSKR